MALLVQKFGGTSLATLTHINHAADLVAKTKNAGHKVVVIVSAMSGETDRLIALANAISDCPDAREYAALVTTGEQVSMALMSMALINRGIEAVSNTGGQAGILTCSQFKKARIQTINTESILKNLEKNKVVVIAGFQGIDKENNTTTLGRGGSDTTAVAIASSLNADECQIYTDVDGVYTADPRIVPTAKRLEQVHFAEMLELSSLGAKVLQIRAVELAGKYNIPLRVLSSSQDGPGTLITVAKNNMEAPLITGIAFSRNEAKISLFGAVNDSGALDVASTILAEMALIGANIDMIVQHLSVDNKTDFAFTVHNDDYNDIMMHLDKLSSVLKPTKISGMNKLSKLSLIGAGLKSHPETVSLMFKTLAEKGISIQLITTSEIKISVLIDSDCLDLGVQALHSAFELHGNSLDESRPIRLPPQSDNEYFTVLDKEH